MSSSDEGINILHPLRGLLKSPDSKIDLLDPPEIVTKKIHKAEAPRIIEGNSVLAFTEFVLLLAAALNRR